MTLKVKNHFTYSNLNMTILSQLRCPLTSSPSYFVLRTPDGLVLLKVTEQCPKSILDIYINLCP